MNLLDKGTFITVVKRGKKPWKCHFFCSDIMIFLFFSNVLKLT